MTIHAQALQIGQTIRDESETFVVANLEFGRASVWVTFTDGTDDSYLLDEDIETA